MCVPTLFRRYFPCHYHLHFPYFTVSPYRIQDTGSAKEILNNDTEDDNDTDNSQDTNTDKDTNTDTDTDTNTNTNTNTDTDTESH